VGRAGMESEARSATQATDDSVFGVVELQSVPWCRRPPFELSTVVYALGDGHRGINVTGSSRPGADYCANRIFCLMTRRMEKSVL
jgi:hypothetical protein